MKKSQTSRMAFPFSILCLIPITALNTWAADAAYAGAYSAPYAYNGAYGYGAPAWG